MNKNNLSIDYYHITDNNNDFKNLYDKILLNKESIYIDIEEFIFRINII